MKARDKQLARRQAKRWAYEQHADVLYSLPAELRHSIDWDYVARDLGIEWPEQSFPDIEEDMQRVLDYLYDDEASDYQDLENSLQCGHIFESIIAVQRWLCAKRS